jgi:hypothetical protein
MSSIILFLGTCDRTMRTLEGIFFDTKQREFFLTQNESRKRRDDVALVFDATM